MTAQTRAERERLVLEQYERLWSGVLEKAQQLLDGGETDLKRLHLFMRRNFGPEFHDPALRKKYLHHEEQKAAQGFLYDGQLIRVFDADTRVITLMTDAVKMRAAIDAFGDVQRIVETGSGWGKTLFNLYLYGAPANAEYHALELTNTGRKVTDLIASKCAQRINIRTHFFNYFEPDFSMLRGDKRTCFITHHSIEQVPELGRGLIEKMLEVPGFHRCVHLEPCGFQIPDNKWLRTRHVWEKPIAIARMKRIDRDNEAFSRNKGQNMNLFPLLKAMEAEGRLRIHLVRKHFTSHLLSNATTLILWGPK
jgi:hypothetical protein